MKFFIDTAHLPDIEEALQRGFISGLTTNPSLLAKEPKGDFRVHIKKIINLFQKYQVTLPLSVEIFSLKADEMVRQAMDFVDYFQYENLYVKIPIGWEELKAITELRKRNIKINCTGLMSFNQAMMAVNAGSHYVSLFYGRVRDTGFDAYTVVEKVATALRRFQSPSEIIVGSIRHLHDINDAIAAGAHIVTIPPQFFPPMVRHPKTDEVIAQFMKDFEAWLS